MLKQCLELRESVYNIDDRDLEKLIPSVTEYRRIEEFRSMFADLDSVTKSLQSDSTTLSDARMLFDTFTSEHPCTKSRLAANARIVHQPAFESGICRILDGEISLLTEAEKSAIGCLCVAKSTSEVDIIDGSCSLAERALKHRKLNRGESDFLDFRFMLPSSNICERFFSIALSNRRKSILPCNFEQQMFLHSNYHLRSIKGINEIVNENEQYITLIKYNLFFFNSVDFYLFPW